MTLFDTIITTFDSWFQGPLAHIATAFVIIILGITVGLFSGTLIQKLLHQIEADKILKKVHIHFSLEQFLGKMASYIIYGIAIILALSQFTISPIFLYIILGVLIVFLLSSILVVMKDLIPNIFCGLILFRHKEFRSGNTIIFGSIKGKIDRFDLIHVVLEIKKGEKMMIPNYLLVKNKYVIEEK